MIPDNGPSKTRFGLSLPFCLGLLLFLATLAVYWQATRFAFTNFDDSLYVTENLHIQKGLSWETVAWSLSFEDMGKTYWHPLTWLSHALDVTIFGMNPGGHHFSSILLHGINVLLLFSLLSRSTRAPWRSAFVAACFALHPLNVDSVVWIAQRKSLLSTLFLFLTMDLYVRYAGGQRPLAYLTALLSHALALTAKPVTVTLPFLLLLLDAWPLGRTGAMLGNPSGREAHRPSQGRLLLEKVPFIILSLAAIFLTYLSQETHEVVVPQKVVPMGLRIENALVGYVTYVLKAFWPLDLAVFYPFPLSIPLWKSVGAGLMLLATTTAVLARARKAPYLPAGWLWYLGSLLPMSGLVQVGLWPAMADRWAYVPLIGIFVMLTWGFTDAFLRFRHGRAVLVVTSGLALLSLGLVTHVQIGYWRSSLTLFGHCLEVIETEEGPTEDVRSGRQGRSPVPHNNYGLALKEEGKEKEAIKHYLLALEIDSGYAPAHNNLGIVLAEQGDLVQAATAFQNALTHDPSLAAAHENYARAKALLGDLAAAETHYGTAAALRPMDPEIQNSLGEICLRQGKAEEAAAHFRAALGIDPAYAPARKNLALMAPGRLAP